MQTSKYFETLFDRGQATCLSPDAFGNSLFALEAIDPNHEVYPSLQYVSINAMDGDSRADSNVTCFRNFLVEFDHMPLEDQLSYVKSLELPYSTVTFSGNKSYHFIISLEEPLDNKEQYTFVIEWIYNILGNNVDKQNKNPSRFTRMPGGTNQKTNQPQELIEAPGRIKNNDLQAWILRFPEHQPKVKLTREEVKLSNLANPSLLSDWTQYLLREGVFNGKRNAEYFKMAFDFYKSGFELDEAIEYVLANGSLGEFSESELRTTFSSAYKRKA
jgi:hypothetical protein